MIPLGVTLDSPLLPHSNFLLGPPLGQLSREQRSLGNVAFWDTEPLAKECEWLWNPSFLFFIPPFLLSLIPLPCFLLFHSRLPSSMVNKGILVNRTRRFSHFHLYLRATLCESSERQDTERMSTVCASGPRDEGLVKRAARFLRWEPPSEVLQNPPGSGQPGFSQRTGFSDL